MSKRARRLAARLVPLQIEMLEGRLLLSAAATTTSLIASANPIELGQAVALTATVTSNSGTPTGAVTFDDGSTTIGTVAVNSTGEAVAYTDSLSQGTHSDITATYSGSSDYASSTSAALTETVDSDDMATTTSLVVWPNPINIGQAVALTATVTATSGSPTGSVTFLDGSTLIGTVAINTTTQQAIGFTASLSAGTHSITASYGGATGFAGSASSAASLVVTNNVSTTTTLVASSNPVTQGQVLALTAAVTAASGTPSGTVTFNDGSTLIGAVAVDPTTLQAVAFTTLTAGAHDITASYGGATGFAASASSGVSVVVNSNVSTKTTLVTSSNPIIAGQVISITATVTGAGGIPSGTVTFNDGSTLIGTATIDPTTGQAIAFTSSLTPGAHSITAAYGGDTGYLASKSSAVSETVNPVGADTNTTLAVSANPQLAGQTIALTATVTSLGGTPSGTVTFDDGSTLIGTVAINTATHQAIGFTSSLSGGTHTLSATYNGTAGFDGSTSSSVSEVVNPIGTLTTTTLATTSKAVVSGELVLLTATVTSTGGTPEGNVTFEDGSTFMGTVPISTSTQQALCYTDFGTIGTHNITAVYAGAGGFATSTSAVLHEVVNADATVTTVIASANNVTVGNVVALIATVTPEAPGGGVPTGTVTFEDGSTLIGTANVAPPGSLITPPGDAIAYTASLTPGAHNITAVYSGANGYSASTSAGLNETIVGVVTTTTVSLSTSAVTMGQTVTFTATVTPAGGGAIPTGTVTFTSGSTTIGTATLDSTGKATFNEYNLFTGTYPVTATYSGDSINATSTASASSSLVITMPTLSTITDSGTGTTMQYAIATAGTGATAQNGQPNLVEVDYTGYLTTGGPPFDSSLNPGRTPFEFGLGDSPSGVITGWQDGVNGMNVGETRVLVIPGPLAYGANPPSGIPVNATLDFIVRLLAVNLPRLTVTYNGATSTQLTLNETPSTTIGTYFGSETIGLSTAASSFTLGDADSNLTLTSPGSPIVQILGADPNDFVITQPPYIVTKNPDGSYTGGVFTI
ncbi:MAG: Ig-like domain repeat protein, partial [Tepidisphaeraceae bacterium]